MRILLRTVAVAAALAAVLGAGASTALAASATGNSASVARYDFDEAWCFDYGSSYDCSVVDGSLFVTITPDGREIGRIHFREVVKTYDPSGVQIGSTRVVALDRTVFADGGQNGTFSVSHTRAVGDFGTCVVTYLLRIVDYDVQIDKYAGPGCN